MISSFLHSIEAMTQGDPLAMIIYGIGISPLIKNLKGELPDVTHTCYPDSARSLGKFTRIKAYFHFLKLKGLVQRYYPKLSKIILIVHPENIKDGNLFYPRHVFNMYTGARYLGGYIGDGYYKHNCLKERTSTWERNIRNISNSIHEISPGDIYHSGTHEPIRVDIYKTCHHRYNGHIGGSGDDDLRNLFASYFLWKEKPLSPILGNISTMLVKKSVLGLLNKVMLANEKYLSSQKTRVDLIKAVTGGVTFKGGDKLQVS